MISNNPAVLDGGQFGTQVLGDGITINGGTTGVALIGPVTLDGQPLDNDNVLTTKGDLLSFSTVPARLAVGTDGQVLVADDSEDLGVKWADAPAVAAAGNDTEIQFNNSNLLDASSDLTWDGSALGVTGNLAFTGTGRRITGDMSNATRANRLSIQTSTTNGITNVQVIPNGTATSSYANVFDAADPDNASRLYMGANVAAGYNAIGSSFSGTGTLRGLFFLLGANPALYLETTGSVVLGNKAALATSATDGFAYIPTSAGTPTGTPTSITGKSPIEVDTTNNKLYFYSGGAWQDATASTPPAGSDTEIQFNDSGAFGASSSLTWDGSALGVGGDIAISGTGKKITGDFSNATSTNRLSFQSSTTDGATHIIARPNGTSNSASFSVETDSTGTNTAAVGFSISNTVANLISYTRGSGTALPLALVSNNVQLMTLNTDATMLLGRSSANLTALKYSAGASQVTLTADNSNTDGTINITAKGAGTINMNSIPVLPTHSVSSLPTGTAGGMIYVSDATPAATMCFYNGANWIDLLTGSPVA